VEDVQAFQGHAVPLVEDRLQGASDDGDTNLDVVHCMVAQAESDTSVKQSLCIAPEAVESRLS
jgi:hypothetical protein